MNDAAARLIVRNGELIAENGEIISFTKSETAILAGFCRCKREDDRYAGLEEIGLWLWPGKPRDEWGPAWDDSIYVHFCHIRRKIEKCRFNITYKVDYGHKIIGQLEMVE